jgi:hypothetical protein
MARVLALVPDLLFGSKVQAMLAQAGHDVELGAGAAPTGMDGVDVLVVDLTAVEPEGLAGAGPRTLGFYAHVEPEVKARAEAAGFDLVVPRSRMNREGAALVERLLSEG